MAKHKDTISNSYEGKYLSFSLAAEDYGISILKVREIIGLMPITSVPQSPEYIKGVINLRGKVIPVIDLRLRLGMPEVPHTDRSCIIVVEADRGQSRPLTGIVVDSVSEVAHLKESDVEETPSFGVVIKEDCVLGMAKVNERIKILLDVDKTLTADGEELLRQTA